MIIHLQDAVALLSARIREQAARCRQALVLEMG